MLPVACDSKQPKRVIRSHNGYYSFPPLVPHSRQKLCADSNVGFLIFCVKSNDRFGHEGASEQCQGSTLPEV